MSQINTPIVIAEGWDVMFFNAVGDAESYLEPTDVRRAIFKGYDAQGRLLTISTDGRRVSISVAEAEPQHARELKALLKGYLAMIGEQVAAGQSDDLVPLLKTCERRAHARRLDSRSFLQRFFHKLFQ